MKQQDPALLAPLLLLLALILLALAEFMGASGYWAWVKAGAEAAAVGGMADWFAVVVLFRHPLGIPIPHTAIIPKNKAPIADSMVKLHAPSQPQRSPQGVVDAGLPALATGTQGSQHISIQTQLDRLFGGDCFGATTRFELGALVQVGRFEKCCRQFRRIIWVIPGNWRRAFFRGHWLSGYSGAT